MLAVAVVCLWQAAATSEVAWLVVAAGAALGLAAMYLATRPVPGGAETTADEDAPARRESPMPAAMALRQDPGDAHALDGREENVTAAAPEDEGGMAATEDGDDAPAMSQLDYDAVVRRLLESGDPMAELKLLVGDIRTRMAANDPRGRGDGSDETPNPAGSELACDAWRGAGDGSAPLAADPQVLSPSPVERFVARMLVEAGLFSKDVDLPRIRVIRSPYSQMLFLRIEESECSYLARLRVLKIEAALNAMRYVCSYFDDPQGVTEVDCYKLMQSLTTSVCAQSPNIDVPIEPEEGDPGDGEWAVRSGIARTVEGMQLPYRLEQRFRANVADGNVAFEVSLTPQEVFPSSVFVPGIGVVQSSREMRRKSASSYALRVAVLLAATAFRTSEKVKHVWVLGSIDTATTHRCYLTIDFDRWRFSRVDMAHVDDLAKVLHAFAPNIRLENDILRPVEQGVSIAEPRFCPPRRFEAVGLSSRMLPERQARVLGTNHVAGLSIEEADKRSLIASDIMLNFTPAEEDDATERNVRAIMALAGDDPDPSVRSAAERTVSHLIEGTLGQDPYAVGEDFVRGDALSRACDAAKEALSRRDATGAVAALEPVLAPLDEGGVYADGPGVEWRYFSNYVDRTLYNRRHGEGGRALLLVPDAYFEAHFYLAVAYLALERRDLALEHARRAYELAPLDKHATLELVRCLEEDGRNDEAVGLLATFLEDAHDPEAIGLGYYRMASFQWERDNVLASQACYQAAMHFMPSIAPYVVMEVSGLARQASGSLVASFEPMGPDDVTRTLSNYDIPIAPTDETSAGILECARASVDAEVFPVAKNFVNVLASFEPNDVIMDIAASMEDLPDL